MARKVGTRIAIGKGHGQCAGCLREIETNTRVTAIAEGRRFLGWFCDECVRSFRPAVKGVRVAERPEPLFAAIGESGESGGNEKGRIHSEADG